MAVTESSPEPYYDDPNAQAVREDLGAWTLSERLQVCDIALVRGPQVIGNYQAGRCLW